MIAKESIVLSMLGMAVLATITTTTGLGKPALAQSSFENLGELTNLGGLLTKEKTTEFGGLLSSGHKGGDSTFLDGPSGIPTGFPDGGSGLTDGLSTGDKLGERDQAGSPTATSSPLDNMAKPSAPGQAESDNNKNSLANNKEAADDGTSEDSPNSNRVAYTEFQGCLSDTERGGESPMEQDVQACYDSAFGKGDNTQYSSDKDADHGSDETGSTDNFSTHDENLKPTQ